MKTSPSFVIDRSMVLAFYDVETSKLEALRDKVKAEAASMLGIDESEFKVVLTIEPDKEGGAV